MLIVKTDQELAYKFLSEESGDIVRLQGQGYLQLIRCIITDKSLPEDWEKAHVDAVQLIYRDGIETNAQFALAVMRKIIIDGCYIQAPNSMMQGIFASDGFFEDLTIKNCIVNNRSPHKITINGFHSGFISNNRDSDGKLLRVTLNPPRIAGGRNVWVIGFKDPRDSPRPLSEIIDPLDGYDHVIDNRFIKTRKGDIYLTNFDKASFRELAKKILATDTDDLCNQLFDLAMDCGDIAVNPKSNRKLPEITNDTLPDNKPINLLGIDTMKTLVTKRVIWETQRMLAMRGLYVANIDGIEGSQTKEAIEQFQNLEGEDDNWHDTLCLRVKEMRPSTMRTEGEFIYEMIKLAKHLGLHLPSQWAYIAATVKHETGGTFKPIEEGSTAGWSPEKLKSWQADLRYAPYHGRNLPQVTWKSNYEKYTLIFQPYDDRHGNDELNFVRYPDLMLDPAVGLFALVHGFKTGAFRKNHFIERYINEEGVDFDLCRLCINGYRKGEKLPDRAKLISRYALEYLPTMESM